MILAAALGAFSAALLADRSSKRLASRSGGSRELAFGIALVHVVHRDSESGWRIIRRPGNRNGGLALAVAAAFAVSAGVSGHPSLALGLAFAIGGALSNHLESLHSGAVVDCFSLGGRLAFNVADLTIVAGVALALVGLLSLPGP